MTYARVDLAFCFAAALIAAGCISPIQSRPLAEVIEEAEHPVYSNRRMPPNSAHISDASPNQTALSTASNATENTAAEVAQLRERLRKLEATTASKAETTRDLPQDATAANASPPNAIPKLPNEPSNIGHDENLVELYRRQVQALQKQINRDSLPGANASQAIGSPAEPQKLPSADGDIIPLRPEQPPATVVAASQVTAERPTADGHTTNGLKAAVTAGNATPNDPANAAAPTQQPATPLVQQAISTTPAAANPNALQVALTSATANITPNAPATNDATVLPNTPVKAADLPSSIASDAAAVARKELNWTSAVEQALASLDRKLEGTELTDREKTTFETYRRLLHVLSNQRESALDPIEGLSAQQQEYWKYQLHGLLVQLENDGTPIDSRRTALSLRHLETALRHLRSESALDVRNVSFCTRVDSFGRYAQFEDNEFKADQEVLLYVEVDNFAAKQLGQEYETELQGSYQIFDVDGKRVADHELPLDKQTCRNHRRDYFIAYRMYMPKKIANGDYRLQLTIEDKKAGKFGQAIVEFEIK